VTIGADIPVWITEVPFVSHRDEATVFFLAINEIKDMRRMTATVIPR
jgi:hypothetical protein